MFQRLSAVLRAPRKVAQVEQPLTRGSAAFWKRCLNTFFLTTFPLREISARQNSIERMD
jgi:hypothetical protein